VNTTVAGGSFPDGTTRHYKVGGTTGFAAQGGKSGGCAIPVGATAITATFSAVTPAGAGYLRAWANGSSEPNSTILTYPKATSVTTGTTVAIKTTSALALAVKNYHGPVNLIVDVTGFYRPQIQGFVGPPGNVHSGSTRILSVTQSGTGVYEVLTDTDVMNCVATVSPYFAHGNYATTSPLNGNKMRVFTWTLPGGVLTPTDLNVYLFIAC
jgi:hypothetical protein